MSERSAATSRLGAPAPSGPERRSYLTKKGDQIVRTKGAANTIMAAITEAEAATWDMALSSM